MMKREMIIKRRKQKRQLLIAFMFSILVIGCALIFLLNLSAAGTKDDGETDINNPSQTIFETASIYNPTTSPETVPVLPTPTTNISVETIEVEKIQFYTDRDVEILTKILYREARGVPSDTEKACVIWCVLNRVDNGRYGKSIEAVATAPHQFAWQEDTPVDANLKILVIDVLERWNNEKNEIETSETSGRVLPKDYLFFHGDGKHNYFRVDYSDYTNPYNYYLDSPYKN